MKLLKILALSAIAITANAQSYQITGTADSKLEGKEILLIDQNDMSTTATCIVKNGAFTFTGNTDAEKMYVVRPQRGKAKAIVFVKDGANVTVDLAAELITTTDNGGLNDKLNTFTAKINEMGNAVNMKAYQMQNEGKSREEIGTVLQKEIEKIYDLYKQAIEENNDNMIGAYILMNVAEQFYPTLDEFDNIVNRVKYAGQLHAIKQIREGLVKAEATSAGKMFVDFQGYAIDGKPSRLSDYVGKGKYVLVDFWASWCGPCKGEIPNLIELQNKFGGDKFMVLGVNVWDDETAFKAALEEEGITYPQIVVPQNNKDNATELYGIKGIPQIILFAPDGTIVKRDLRGQAMKDLVEEKMKK